MTLADASPADVAQATRRLALAFAQDPITGFLLQQGPGYAERLIEFFSLLMRARLALGMPVLLAREGGEGGEVQGAAMGYTTRCPAWPADIAAEWDRFEASVPGLRERLAVYDEVAEKFKPSLPHYYLGVIGVAPGLQGRGVGRRLLAAFCERSAADGLSGGVYLETAEPANLGFYEGAGFVQTGRGKLGEADLWCLFLPQPRDEA